MCPPGAYFNAVDLANIGHQMDEAERARMAEGGVHSADYSSFLTVRRDVAAQYCFWRP